jgi:acetyltransferase-like isoleucine patch superfamily enzyme
MYKILWLLRLPFYEKCYLLEGLIAGLFGFFFHRIIFAEFGHRSWIKNPDRIAGAEKIRIGEHTHIEKGAVLYAIQKFAKQKYRGQIMIGNHVYLNRFFNATSASKITIKDYVICGSNVSLLNYDHGWQDIHKDISSTPLLVHGEIEIGTQTWIGNNVVILGGVSIGRHCVIGAGSIVTKDIPDYSVAVGNPAKVIKQYNFQTEHWEAPSMQANQPSVSSKITPPPEDLKVRYPLG